MRAVQEAVLAEMRRWGYRFVVTSTLESLEVFARGLGPEQQRRLFKLSDADRKQALGRLRTATAIKSPLASFSA